MESIDINDYDTNMILFKNYLINIENISIQDWSVFNQIIVQPWRNFEVFGFEWNNNNLIFKLISFVTILWVGRIIL